MGFFAPVITFFAPILGSAIGQMAIGLGLNLIVAKMEKRAAKKAQSQAGGTQFDREYGENTSRKAACGPVGIAGQDCYVNTYGDANKNLEQIYQFSDFPCDGLSKIWAGGSQLNIARGNDGRYAVLTGDYAGRMFFTFYDGTQMQADAGLIANSNPLGRWTADHVGSGICYLKVELVYDQEKLNQFPDFFFEIRGARLYDLRKDSSRGGNGNHRWGDYSTYEYTENPVIMDYNYRRGFVWNGDLFLGMGMPESDLPFERYVTAANICDEFTFYGRRARCSILLDADLDHGDNIDSLMLSCGGIVVDGVEGSWPIIGSEQPIVATFTDEDIIASEPLRFRKRRSMGELVNSVSGTYQEPGNMWSPAGYDQQTDAGHVAADRRNRDEALNFPMVFSKGQANQLASIYFNENRFEATAELVLRPRFKDLKAGDWVYWDSKNEKRRGTYMVSSRAIKALDSDGPRNVALSLQERSGLIYKAVGVIPPTIPLPNAQPVYLAALLDYAVIPVIGVGADGRTYPGFRLSWTKITDVTVQAIEFEYWIKSEPNNVFTRTVPADKTLTILQEGILSLTDYQFRYKLVADRPTSWVLPITVRSRDGGNADIEVGLGQVRKDISGRLEELQAGLDQALQLIASLADGFSLEGAVGFSERKVLRRNLGKAFGEIATESRVRLDGQTALAQQIQTVSAGVDTAKAQIANVDTARVDGDKALAESINTVRAEMEDVLADGYLAITAQTNGDTLSKIELAARARKGEQAALAALIMRVYQEAGVLKTENIHVANRTIFVDDNGENGQALATFTSEGLTITAAHIDRLRTGYIGGDNNKMEIDVKAGTLVFRS
ncbi:phage tail protein [Agrobacterium larrymoorei]|uniref:Tip attachment protein J domain-containing protein n=1 Tax=Agrobacterium larrymoorei TaxID=160699 RepID=A0ABU0UF77_9HYPH|nr:phage tail protein [Agrobacterium larrymoorei]MDQ1183589.1 hypothetical protein [Agrobacterium larrymoorei]